MKLLIGCPVRSREWIIARYLEYACEAAQRVTDDFSFVFIAPVEDYATIAEIERKSDELGVVSKIVTIDEETAVDRRVWNLLRYEHMAYLRNVLLNEVRMAEPDLFLSLDSDILIHPEQVTSMVANLEDFDAIGGKAYLSSNGRVNPTYGLFKRNHEGAFIRSDAEGVIKVDVLMAIKLMGPNAWAIDYQPNRYGEDIGWSRAAKTAGLRFRWDGTFISKHVMAPALLEEVDARVGF